MQEVTWVLVAPEGLRYQGGHAAAGREEKIEAEHQADDRERFQNTDAEEEEREDVAASFRLTRDRFDGLRGDDTVTDGGAQGDGRDNQREAEDQDGGEYGFRSHDVPFRICLVFVGRSQREIDDAQEGEDERLDRADQEVEELDPDRSDGGKDGD